MAKASSVLEVWRDLYLVNRRVTDELNARLVAEAGCSLLEHDLMAWLAAAPNKRLRMLDLAARLRISPGGLTRATNRLVSRGWVTRETPTHNRREVHAILTDAGEVAFEAARTVYASVLVDTIAASLDAPALARLGQLARQLSAELTATDRPKTPASR